MVNINCTQTPISQGHNPQAGGLRAGFPHGLGRSRAPGLDSGARGQVGSWVDLWAQGSWAHGLVDSGPSPNRPPQPTRAQTRFHEFSAGKFHRGIFQGARAATVEFSWAVVVPPWRLDGHGKNHRGTTVAPPWIFMRECLVRQIARRDL